MKIFLTGGTGYVGRRVAAELSRAGHEVVTLVRTAEGRDRAREGGIDAVLGDLAVPGDPNESPTWIENAEAVDAIVHLAFDYGDPVGTDAHAIDTLLAATEGREAQFVYTSGMWVLGDTGGETVAEDAPTDQPAAIVAWRVRHERRVLEAAAGPGGTAVIRLGHVYGRGGGPTARMFATAAKKGSAEYLGDGRNLWSNVHVDDVAKLYRLVVECRAGGVIHAVDGVPQVVSEMAAAASRAAGAGGETTGIPLERARERLGALADAFCLDQSLAAPAARALGWVPSRPSFIEAADEAWREWEEVHEEARSEARRGDVTS